MIDDLIKTNRRVARLEDQRQTEGGRIRLSSGLTLYVRSDGSDSNSGQTNDAGGAFATIQAAIDYAVQVYDPGLSTVVIQVQDGVWTLPSTLSLRPHMGALFTLRGNVGAPSSCIVEYSGTVVQAASEYAPWKIEGLRLRRATAIDVTLLAAARSILTLGRMGFGDHGNGVVMLAADMSVIDARSQTFDIGVGGFSLARSIEHSILRINGATFVLPAGGAAYTGAFATADNHGSLYASGNTFTNGALVTGTRYVTGTMSHIATSGGGANYFPGNAAGGGTGAYT